MNLGANNKFKKSIFYLVLMLMPLVIILTLEVALRFLGYGNNLDLFQDVPEKEYSNYRMCNPNIGEKYFSKLEFIPTPGNDLFLKDKPVNCFRVFILGSSSVVGFPYSRNLMFSRIIQKRLQDAFPDKKIEMVNTAITATNSYTLLDYIDEILDEKPDAILIYAGHNEFYGALGIGSTERIGDFRKINLLHLKLIKFRTYQLLQNSILSIGKFFAGKHSSDDIKGSLMTVIAKNKEIELKSKIYNEGIDQFTNNISDLLQKANNKHVPVFISEVVSNVHDLAPFGSKESGKYASALKVYNEAKELEAKGKFKEAKLKYYEARDLDCVRFRASADINNSIHSLSKKYKAFLVPIQEYFENASPNGFIGDNLLTEHVHPNIKGIFLIADAFFVSIVKSKIIGEKLNLVYYKNSDYYKLNWGYTTLDSLVGLHRVNNLKCWWPYKPLGSSVIDYRTIYKPASNVDSIAFEVFKGTNLNNIEAHNQLAKYFMSKKDMFNAYKEYNAMLATDPYAYKPYLEAANCLLALKDYSTAFEVADESLKCKKTFQAYFLKGAILLMKNDYKESARCFSSAFGLVTNTDDKIALLSQLYEAYYLDNQAENAKSVLKELQKLQPGFLPKINLHRIDFNSIIPFQVEGLINDALTEINKGNTDDAIKLLLASLNIKETSLANRLAGELLTRKNVKKAELFLLRAYPDYKNELSYLENLCVYYIKFRNLQNAISILNRMKKINPRFEGMPVLEKQIKSNLYPSKT